MSPQPCRADPVGPGTRSGERRRSNDHAKHDNTKDSEREVSHMTPERTVYMDHSATTATDPEVVEAMLPWFSAGYGNPSSLYRIARESRAVVEEARAKVAAALRARSDEIYFTSGGTESDNWAIKGVAYANRKKGDHIITSAIEHHAVLHTCEYLEKQGFSVTYLPVDEYGQIRIDDLRAAITDKTILVTIMFANNEIGTIEPIAEIGKVCREKGVLFHTDAVQAIGSVPIDVDAMKIDLLSLSAHKLYGPKGIGALFIRKGVKIDNLLHGGGQEHRRRAGTENIAGIVGLGCAIEKAVTTMDQRRSPDISTPGSAVYGNFRADPKHQAQRPPHQPASGKYQHQFRFHRRGIHAASAGSLWYLCFYRECLHIGITGTVPCPAGNRTARRNSTWVPATYPGN
jgi:cysteine desulfurase